MGALHPLSPSAQLLGGLEFNSRPDCPGGELEEPVSLPAPVYLGVGLALGFTEAGNFRRRERPSSMPRPLEVVLETW